MCKTVFTDIRKCALFKDVVVGKKTPAYEMNKYIGDPIVPQELDVFMSNPIYRNVHLFWSGGTFGEEGSNPVIPGDRKRGSYAFILCSPTSGARFRCGYDPVAKVFRNLIVVICRGRLVSLSNKLCTASDLSFLLEMSPLEFVEYIRDNAEFQRRPDKWIDRLIKRLKLDNKPLALTPSS